MNSLGNLEEYESRGVCITTDINVNEAQNIRVKSQKQNNNGNSKLPTVVLIW